MTEKEKVRAGKSLEDVLGATDSDSQQVAVRDNDAALTAATAETVLGVPESSDEDMVGAFVIWLQEKADQDNTDTMAMLAQALRQADNATSLADALRETPTISSKDCVDRPFLCYGYTIHEGQYEDSELPFFASLDVQFKELSERVIINTGAFKVLAVLQALDRIDEWPLPLVFTGKATRRGRTVVSLKYLG